MKIKLRPVISAILSLLCLASQAQVSVSKNAYLMGGQFHITLVSKDSATASEGIDSIIAEITRIEYLISDWKAGTQV